MSTPNLLLASVASGQGCTTACLALAMALMKQGQRVSTFKTGPDVNDALLHSLILSQPCLNIDSWSLRLETATALLDDAGDGFDILIGDGHGGLFDDGAGQDADLASLFGLPVILVLDVKGAGASLAPMVDGLLRARADVDIAGIWLNRVHSREHADHLTARFDERFSTPVVGYLTDDAQIALDDRHDQAARAIDEEAAALARGWQDAVAPLVDLGLLARLARPRTIETMGRLARPLPLLGQRIAVAQDEAFCLGLEAVLTGWRRQGAQILPFSPLADEAPSVYADAIYLPSGPLPIYPKRLAGMRTFLRGLASAASRGAFIHGEGLGYAMLASYLTDLEGNRLAMAGLLPVELTATEPGALAGYRKLILRARHPLGASASQLRGFEPDQLTGSCDPNLAMFDTSSPEGADMGPQGCQLDQVSGSTACLFDRHPHLSIVSCK